MRRFCLMLAGGISVLTLITTAQPTATTGPYKVLKTAKVGGAGGFDYVYADVAGRRLYIPRYAATRRRVTVFNLDTLEPVGEIADAARHGAAVDPKSDHGFASSKPVVMWDTQDTGDDQDHRRAGRARRHSVRPVQPAHLRLQPQRAQRHGDRRRRMARWSARSIWAARQNRRSPTARATCMSISKTRTTSRSWTPRP